MAKTDLEDAATSLAKKLEALLKPEKADIAVTPRWRTQFTLVQRAPGQLLRPARVREIMLVVSSGPMKVGEVSALERSAREHLSKLVREILIKNLVIVLRIEARGKVTD